MIVTMSLRILIHQRWRSQKQLDLIIGNVLSMSTKLALYNLEKYWLINILSMPKINHIKTSNDYKNKSAEIDFAFNILINSKVFPNSFKKPLWIMGNFEIDKVIKTLNSKWIHMNSIEILKHMETISWCAYENKNINRMDYIIILHKILYNLKSYNDTELIHFFKSLELVKNLLNINCDHFSKKLDDICYSKLKNMSIENILLIMYYFYRLNIQVKSKFVYEGLIKVSEFDNLNRENVLQFAFLLRVNKKCDPVELSKLEHYCIKYAKSMNINELIIAILPLYKFRYYIGHYFATILINKLKSNINNTNSVFLTTIIKVLKMTDNSKLILIQFQELIDFLAKRVSNLHISTLTHISHLQSRICIKSDEIFLEILERTKNFDHWRLKDIERITFTMFQLNYKPETTSFYSKASNELLTYKREKEIKRWPLTFLRFAQFLLQVNYFDENIIKIIMEYNFISHFNFRNLTNEYLIIEKCLELDHPEYNISEIAKSLSLAMYRNIERNNLLDDNFSMLPHFVLDVISFLKLFFDSDESVYIDRLLPHIVNYDIIICYNEKNNQFLRPKEKVSKISMENIKYAPKDGNIWYAIVCIKSINLILNTDEPIGYISMRLRHLKSAGYKPILITETLWRNCNKLAYLNSIFHQ